MFSSPRNVGNRSSLHQPLSSSLPSSPLIFQDIVSFNQLFIEVYLVYNVVLISTEQQSDSVIIHSFSKIWNLLQICMSSLCRNPHGELLRSLSLQDIQSHFHFYKNHSGCHMKNCSETQGWNPRRTVQRLLQKPPEKSQGPKIK